MRITGGALGGRALAAPRDNLVRPTADKVRQAIFNILAHNNFDGGFALDAACVIDLFAGTGALGIEALSRGARYCLFVEENAESRALIRHNVEVFNLTGATKIWRRDALKLGAIPAGAGGPFNLAFLDPPYRKNLLAPALAGLREGGWLTGGAIAVAECATDETLPSTDGYAVLDERLYGETKLFIVRATAR